MEELGGCAELGVLTTEGTENSEGIWGEGIERGGCAEMGVFTTEGTESTEEREEVWVCLSCSPACRMSQVACPG